MCKIFVERKPLGVSMPEFWSWASTTGLHNTNEDFYHPIKETQCQNSNLWEQHVTNK